MPSEMQIEANRANAQHSTGPTSAAGKARAATNGLTHGLNSSPASLFAEHPEQHQAHREYTLKLRRDCCPDSELEEDAVQAKRGRHLETIAGDR